MRKAFHGEMDSPRGSLFIRRLRQLGLWIFGLLIVGLIQLEMVVILYPQESLTIDSGEVKADAIVVLGGGLAARPERAAELFKQGAAPKVVVSGVGDNDAYALVLMQHGVPQDAIVREGKSASTRENALFSIPLFRQMGAHRVIIVTSWYHSRRALYCFKHFAPDITFYSRPSYSGYPTEEWDLNGMRGYVRAEYVKLPGYWMVYGVRPF
jgi:uncharacterized SAM-binding protein YcdF (DUF218 family)